MAHSISFYIERLVRIDPYFTSYACADVVVRIFIRVLRPANPDAVRKTGMMTLDGGRQQFAMGGCCRAIAHDLDRGHKPSGGVQPVIRLRTLTPIGVQF